MKAAIYHRYGSPDVIAIEDVPAPAPSDGEVLLKVRAASLNPLDSHLMRGNPKAARIAMGLKQPKMNRPGVDVSGIVEATGGSVTQFKPGDDVFGTCEGACAEYAVTRESKLVLKPRNITFEEAAAVPVAALTSLQALRDKARLESGQHVLVHGAAGGCGTFGVQIARWLGAEVTAVCSTRNVEFVRSLGAHHVIDYTRDDFTKGDRRYHVIYDLVADHSIAECYRVLTPNGVCVGAGILGSKPSIGVMLSRPLQALARKPFDRKRFMFFISTAKREDLITLQELLRTGTIKSVIDRVYPLEQTAEALHYLEGKHARGKVVVRVSVA